MDDYGGRLGPRRDEKMGQVLYFAYGSNLDDEQMRSRCASAQPVARAVLPNYALAFGGFSHRWDGAVASVVRARARASRGSSTASTTRTSARSIASRATRSPTSAS
jgi:hypothetical protein